MIVASLRNRIEYVKPDKSDFLFNYEQFINNLYITVFIVFNNNNHTNCL